VSRVPECGGLNGECEEETRLNLLDECQSVLRVLESPQFCSRDRLRETSGEMRSSEWPPPAEVVGRIARIMKTRANNWREVLAKKEVMKVFAERYGDPSDIWVIMLKGGCEELDLAASRLL
jgi:DNA-directed RNA polymerase subunit F